MLSFGILSLLISQAEAVSIDAVPVGGLIISEVMSDPNVVVDYLGEYIEIYNAHSAEIDINGLVVTSSNEAGFTVNTSITIPVGGYAVLASSSNSSSNGGNTEVDFAYSYSSMKLGNYETITLANSTDTLDTVSYNINDYPVVSGVSMILDNDSLTSTDNDSDTYWCAPSSVFGDGDLGSPGSANASCTSLSSLSVGDLLITEIMHDPTKVSDTRGEWFEVYNTTLASINIRGLTFTSTGDTGFTVQDNVIIAAGGYAVMAARNNSLSNGGFTGDYQYTYSSNSVRLGKTDSVGIEANGTVIDSVSYNKFTFGYNVGTSHTLASGAFSESDNDSSGSWCDATSAYGDGDFGTPGSANDVCNIDFDGDGVLADTDCDDSDAAIQTLDFYLDGDGDGEGDLNASPLTGECTAPSGYVANNTDCDDANSAVNTAAVEECDNIDNDCDSAIDDADDDLDSSTGDTWYTDGDSDNYGDDATAEQGCDLSSTKILIGGDCNDADGTVNPGATEIINGIDDNCDGISDGLDDDSDGDGETINEGDCNDNDSSINTAATEVCDGADNNCDGVVDENTAADVSQWYTDGDTDGFPGDSFTTACNQPLGTYSSAFQSSNRDCNDGDANISPDATETPDDGLDSNCDSGDLCYTDGDGDGYRDAALTTVLSTNMTCGDAGTEWDGIQAGEDCNDSNATVFPGATEVCDGNIDNDCNGLADDNDGNLDTNSLVTYYIDSDNDTYGVDNVGTNQQACLRPTGYSAASGDCDDSSFDLKPFDKDNDGFDRCSNDCDDDNINTYPGAAAEDAGACMNNDDGDSYGDTNRPLNPYGGDDGVPGNDCDDTDGQVFPTAAANETSFCTKDADGDGWGDSSIAGTDCEDGNANIFIGAATNEGSLCTIDSDGDGYGSLTATSVSSNASNGTDCDDSSSVVSPVATEICDGLDNNCDSVADEGLSVSNYYPDTDSDGEGDEFAASVSGCEAPANHVENNDDCDDTDTLINTSATEVCFDGVDQDCDGGDNTSAAGSCSGGDLSSADFNITGNNNDKLGQAVSYAGSIVGGNSSPDFAVTSRWANSSQGAVYLFDGSGSLTGTQGSSSATVTINGRNTESFGYDVSGGTSLLNIGSHTLNSDFNGDGNTDLVVGATTFVTSDGNQRGAAYVFYGPLTGTLDSSNADVIFSGEDTPNNIGTNAGNQVAFIGDVNGDTFGDLLVADDENTYNPLSGEAYIIFGTNTAGQYTGDNGLAGVHSGNSNGVEIHPHSSSIGLEELGSAVNAIGDANGDGISDIMIAAWRYDAASGTAAKTDNDGAVFVWYGGGSIGSSDLTISQTPSNHTPDVTFVGESAGTSSPHSGAGDQFGQSADGAGDFNCDGFADVIVGSQYGDYAGNDSGVAYVLDASNGGSYPLNSNPGVIYAKLNGEAAGDNAGRSVAGVGNINGDGNSCGDVVIGAKRADKQGAFSNSGSAYLVYGSSSALGTISLSNADVILGGESSGDEAGIAVSGMDDIDSDGTPEFLVGAYKNGSSNNGKVHLMLGSNF
jgi:hypothetical protein